MDKENRFLREIKRIKLGLKKFGLLVRHVCPNIIIESAILATIISTLCFGGSIASIVVENIDVGDAKHDVNVPSNKVDFELNMETAPAPDRPQSTEPQMETVQYKTSQICFIGDSRVADIETAVYTDAHFIARSSVGFGWLKKTATVEFEKIRDEIKVCVVALGIDELSNPGNYITVFNEFAEKYPDIIFVYSTVGPINETQCTEITNSSIEDFNKSIIAGLCDRWQIIDQYAYLKSNGFSAYDGLHYGNAVSASVFAWTVDSVSIQTIDVIN